jgi:hypothetical protein
VFLKDKKIIMIKIIMNKVNNKTEDEYKKIINNIEMIINIEINHKNNISGQIVK